MSAKDSTARIEYRETTSLPDFRFGGDGSVQKFGRGGQGTKIPCGQWSTIKASPRPTGYFWFYPGSRSNTKPLRLDEAICEAWHGPRHAGTECLPRDGDRKNVRPDNLYWGLLPENIMAPDVDYREWDYIPGYRLGSDGSIWSAWGQGNESPSDIWRRMTPTRLDSGHLQVHVKTIDGDRKYGLHHLIATAFYGPCPNGLECCHQDGVPDNNVSTNLRWGTRKSNAEDSVAHGVQVRGERQWSAKLTNEQVVKIRSRYAEENVSVSELARQSNMSVPGMSDLITGHSWSHLPGAVPIRSIEPKLDLDKVREIRRLYESGGISQFKLAVRFGVSPNTIYEVIARKAWAHVK